jgi:hypothetical protein
MSDRLDQRPEGAPGIDDPFLLALRYNDSDVEELGLDAAIEKHGLDLKTLEYAAEQRALRFVLTKEGRAEELYHGNAVPLSHSDEALIDALVPLYVDAILAGWRAKAIVDRQGETS